MVTVEWKGKMAFVAEVPSGTEFLMDAYPESGGEGRGPTPLEAFMSSLAACTAMDVISILRKKQQVVTSYRVEVDGVRPPEGQFPRPFESMTIRHIVGGENIGPAAVARAVQLSEEKYCTVMATLRQSPPVAVEWVIEGRNPAES